MGSKGNTGPLLAEAQTCTAPIEISKRMAIYLFQDPAIPHSQRMPHPTTETLAQPYSLLIYPQQPETGNTLDVPQQKNG